MSDHPLDRADALQAIDDILYRNAIAKKVRKIEWRKKLVSQARERGKAAGERNEPFDRPPYSNNNFNAPLIRAWESGYREAIERRNQIPADSAGRGGQP